METATAASEAAEVRVLLLSPSLGAVSGVATHANQLMASGSGRYEHFAVGSEGRPGETGFGQILRLVLSPFLLARALLRGGFPVVHINTSMNPKAFWRDAAYILVARLFGRGVLLQVHGGRLEPFLERCGRLAPLALAVLQRADRVVTITATEQAAHAARLKVPVVCIPNAVGVGDIGPGAREAGQPLQALFIGRLHRDKGLFEALEAIALLVERGEAIRLTLAGSGPEREALCRRIGEMRLEAVVRFVGPVAGEEKSALFRDADVLLLPSYHEGLPYAVLEALAAGLAVVATAVGGIPEAVGDGSEGRLVPAPPRPQQVAAALAELAGDRELLCRMQQAARRRACESYDASRMGERFAVLYREIVTQPEPS